MSSLILPPQEPQKSLPEHAGPTHYEAKARASQRLAGRIRTQAYFYHSVQEHDPLTLISRAGAGSKTRTTHPSGGTHCHRHRAYPGPQGWKHPVSSGHCSHPYSAKNSKKMMPLLRCLGQKSKATTRNKAGPSGPVCYILQAGYWLLTLDFPFPRRFGVSSS